MRNPYRMAFSVDAIVVICALLFYAVSCAQDPCTLVEKRLPGAPIYENDFSGDLDGEWSVGKRETSPTGVQFLGRFSAELAQLSLSGLPSHTDIQAIHYPFVGREFEWPKRPLEMQRCKRADAPDGEFLQHELLTELSI